MSEQCPSEPSKHSLTLTRFSTISPPYPFTWVTFSWIYWCPTTAVPCCIILIRFLIHYPECHIFSTIQHDNDAPPCSSGKQKHRVISINPTHTQCAGSHTSGLNHSGGLRVYSLPPPKKKNIWHFVSLGTFSPHSSLIFLPPFLIFILFCHLSIVGTLELNLLSSYAGGNSVIMVLSGWFQAGFMYTIESKLLSELL